MFLPTVAPTTGVNYLCCLTQPNNQTGKKSVIHRRVDFSNPQSVSHGIEYLQARGSDIYFALGAFKRGSDGVYSREAVNCSALRSLWLDIDAGETKYKKHGDAVYRTQQEAIDALLDFLDEANFLPPTYIVSSGEGLHVYWALDTDISVQHWTTLAKKLRVATKAFGLKVDPARTVDAASILRLPNTLHSASGNTVTVLHEGAPYDVDTIDTLLDRFPIAEEPKLFDWVKDAPNFASSDPLSGIELTQDTPKSFEKIILLERDEHAGCAQLYWIYRNQNEVPEPLWRAGLSIANFCQDRDTWVHKLSDQYDNYIPDEAEQKASACRGPYTCETFESLRPEGCANCPHKARGVKSPIVLGINPENVPTQVIVKNNTTNVQEVFTVPTYPAPFFRKPHGGIWVKAKQKQVTPEGWAYEVEVEKCVWPYDFYITERVAETNGQKYWCKHHSPRDGVREFDLTSDDVAGGGDTLWKALYGQGLPIQEDMRKYMSKYIQAMVKQRVETTKAREACHSIGWTNDDTFILGDKEYTPHGARPAPVSSTKMANMFVQGTKLSYPADCADDPLKGWRDLLGKAYPNTHRSALAGQYIICSSIGAPICARFALDDQRSGLINSYSDGTGHGKTLATALACRVYGDPSTFTIKGRSQGATINAFFEMLGYAQSIPLVRDEITEMTADELSDIAYALVNGKTKIRLQGQHNDIREGEKEWGTYVLSTSNRSIVDTLVNKKGDPTAQYSRVTEFEYPLPTWINTVEDRSDAARLVRRSEEFAGVAGVALVNWMVNNYELAKQMYTDTYDMLARTTAAPRNKARFWLNHATGVVVGALVGEMLGLHPFNADAIMAYAVEVMDNMWRRSESTVVTVDDALGDMLASCIDQWLVINKEGLPISTVHRDILVRVELATNTMWITQTAITEYARRRERNAGSISAFIASMGGVREKKRMLAGTAYAAGSTSQRVWAIDLAEAAKLGYTDLLPIEDTT